MLQRCCSPQCGSARRPAACGVDRQRGSLLSAMAAVLLTAHAQTAKRGRGRCLPLPGAAPAAPRYSRRCRRPPAVLWRSAAVQSDTKGLLCCITLACTCCSRQRSEIVAGWRRRAAAPHGNMGGAAGGGGRRGAVCGRGRGWRRRGCRAGGWGGAWGRAAPQPVAHLGDRWAGAPRPVVCRFHRAPQVQSRKRQNTTAHRIRERSPISLLTMPTGA